MKCAKHHQRFRSLLHDEVGCLQVAFEGSGTCCLKCKHLPIPKFALTSLERVTVSSCRFYHHCHELHSIKVAGASEHGNTSKIHDSKASATSLYHFKQHRSWHLSFPSSRVPLQPIVTNSLDRIRNCSIISWVLVFIALQKWGSATSSFLVPSIPTICPSSQHGSHSETRRGLLFGMADLGQISYRELRFVLGTSMLLTIL